jgi:hypothetical protein
MGPHWLPDIRSSIGIDFSPEKLVHKKRQLYSYLLIWVGERSEISNLLREDLERGAIELEK